MMICKKTISKKRDWRTAVNYWPVNRSSYKISKRRMCNAVFNITIKTGFGNICFRGLF